MSRLIDTYTTTTANGSKVVISRRKVGTTTAWQHIQIYEDIATIELLTDTDYQLIESLGFPRWYFDFTGKGITLPLHKQEYVCQQIIKELNFKTPYEQLEE